MQFKKRKLLVGAILIALAIAGVVATGALTKDDKKALETVAKTRPALSVTTTTLDEVQWPRSLTASGSIAAWQEAIIGAEIGGLRLTEVRVNVGDQVKRGQLLARIAPETVEAEFAHAKAAAEEAQAMHDEAIANANRSRQLRTANFISAQQVAQAVAAEQASAARLAAARAGLRSNQLRLAQTRVVAPDDGVISARAAAVGSLTQPGQELFRLIRQNRLEWRAEVTAAELPRIKPGQAVRLTTDGANDVKGQVRMAAPTVDPQTRTGLVYVDLPAGSPARAGTFARGEFDLGQAPALSLPQSAVLLRDGFSYVFKLVDQNRVQLAKVSVGRRIGDRIEVTDGLAAGTRVVANGAAFLADGDTVRVIEAAAPPAQSANNQ